MKPDLEACPPPETPGAPASLWGRGGEVLPDICLLQGWGDQSSWGPGTLLSWPQLARVCGGSQHPQLKHKHLSHTYPAPPPNPGLSTYPSIDPKAQYPGHLASCRADQGRGVGLGLQPDPTRKPESPGTPLLPGLSGGQLSGTGVFSLPTPLSWAGLCPAPPCLFPRAPAALGWVAEPSCFRDPRRCPPGSLDCVWRSGGWGAGLGRGAGEETPHQESQRQGCALPQEPPLRPPALLPAPGWPAAFPSCLPCPLHPSPPCPALRCMDPQARAARKEHGEPPTNAKKTVGGATPPPPPAAHSPSPLSRRTICLRGVPTPSLPWAEPLPTLGP